MTLKILVVKDFKPPLPYGYDCILQCSHTLAVILHMVKVDDQTAQRSEISRNRRGMVFMEKHALDDDPFFF
jgi:hypothetical protein